MKILIVSSYLPYPLLNGGNIRLYNIIKSLQDKHEITLVCEKRETQTQDDVKEVEKICKKVITVKRNKQWSIKNILKSGFSSIPFLVQGHTSKEFQDAISAELDAGGFDLIHVETFYVMQNVPDYSLPIVLVEHNIEYLVYERFMQKVPFILKPFLAIDINKIKKIEMAFWNQAKIIATVSDQERKIIGKNNCYVVANGVDTKQFAKKTVVKDFAKKQKKVLFIGDYAWLQNSDAARYIIEEVWPFLSSQEDLSLWIVGRNMPQSLKDLGRGDKRIFFDDKNTSSASEIFTEADLLLAPIRVGGGTSYKIIESMAVGTPVVTTSLGHEGIDVQKDRDILVADDPESLSRAVCDILLDEERYQKLSSNSRKAVERIYDWSVIAKKMDEVYQKALAG